MTDRPHCTEVYSFPNDRKWVKMGLSKDKALQKVVIYFLGNRYRILVLTITFAAFVGIIQKYQNLYSFLFCIFLLKFRRWTLSYRFKLNNKLQIGNRKMSTSQEVLTKLHKLKEQASAASNYDGLAKVQAKANKIRDKLHDYKNNKQFMGILDKIDLLVKEKNKYFRQQIIKNSNKLINDSSFANAEADRTLKYSKSAQNLKDDRFKRPQQKSLQVDQQNYKTVSTSSKMHENRNVSENRNKTIKELQEDNDRMMETYTVDYTRGSNKQVNNSMKNIRNHENQHQESEQKTIYNRKSKGDKQKLSQQVNIIDQKVAFSFKQIEDLTKKISALELEKQKAKPEVQDKNRLGSPMTKNYFVKQETIVDEYNMKLREKAFIIEDQKAKIEYFKTMNDELKNRVVNEQRRSEDYIEGLKSEIKKLTKQNQKYQKENRDLQEQVDDLSEKNDGLLNEVKKIVAKLQQQNKDKEKLKKQFQNIINSKVSHYQKQISNLNQKIINLEKFEIKTQTLTEQKQNFQKFNNKLLTRISEIQQESKKYHQQRDKIELQLFRLQQSNHSLAQQLKTHILAKEVLAEELLDAKQKLEEQNRVNQLLEYENDLKTKSKLNKLKQIKGLITELK